MQIQIQFGNACQKVPVVYHDSYNLRLLPYSMNQLQLMIPDKPAKVYSILQRMFRLIIIIKLLQIMLNKTPWMQNAQCQSEAVQ